MIGGQAAKADRGGDIAATDVRSAIVLDRIDQFLECFDARAIARLTFIEQIVMQLAKVVCIIENAVIAEGRRYARCGDEGTPRCRKATKTAKHRGGRRRRRLTGWCRNLSLGTWFCGCRDQLVLANEKAGWKIVDDGMSGGTWLDHKFRRLNLRSVAASAQESGCNAHHRPRDLAIEHAFPRRLIELRTHVDHL